MYKDKKDKEKEERSDRLQFQGEVTEAMPGTLFKVQIDTNSTVLATLAGKLRQNRIRILPGDIVTVECSVYDLSRGRIVWRR
jgi:translation initiation factor IF-1